MVNRNRGPRGRFSRKVNNEVSLSPQTHENNQLSKPEDISKRRRLNDGSAQYLSPTPVTPTPAKEIRSPTKPPHSAQAHELKQLVQDQKNYPLRTAYDADQVAEPVNKPSAPKDKRTLRSQDNIRPRSELTNFFADFNEVVYGDTDSHDTLTPDTSLHIVNSIPRASNLRKPEGKHFSSPHTSRHSKPSDTISAPLANNALTRERLPVRPPSNTKKPIFRRIHFPAHSKDLPVYKQDPLSDDIYEVAHRRGERKEKQARNWDKERAMHEKGELERLLEELRGPDWLKLMGITCNSESDLRKYKLKRNVFITRAKNMLERYETWKERDRELKLDRERRQAETRESSSPEQSSQRSSSASSEETESDHGAGLSTKAAVPSKRPITPPPEEPITTFFEKPHLREAALRGYRRGRRILAFGHPIPELPEAVEFELPVEVKEARG